MKTDSNGLSEKATQLEGLIKIITTIDLHCCAGEFNKVDSILASVCIRDESTTNLVGYCRATSSARQYLSQWKNFVNTVAVEIESRGYDPKRTLRGLM